MERLRNDASGHQSLLRRSCERPLRRGEVLFAGRANFADKTRMDLLKWQLGGGRESWPSQFPSPFEDKPPQRVDAGLRVTLVGHASYLIQTGGLNILMDPVWSERASPVRFAGPRRVNAPGIGLADLPRIDAVLVTHNHYDHLDWRPCRN